MKIIHKEFWSRQPAGLMALLLSAVAVLPVPAGTSDSQTPTTSQTEIANMTNADMRMEVLPVTSVGASDTNAEFTILRAKAEKGDAQSQFELGAAFSLGKLGMATNYVEAVKWFRKAAEQNYAEAQCNLGVCYATGQGVTTNYAEAVKWFRKAVEQNYADAQFNLGVCYANGQGVTKDEREAVKWSRKAAEQNHPGAQSNLGICYAMGQGVEKDDAEAVKFYRKAAEQNYANAQYNLGVCYATGQGVAQDAVEAVKWWRKAAEQNWAEAQYNLGVGYANAHGVAMDQVEAVKWYRKVAEQNYAMAQNNLGVCYYQGQGVAQDAVEAVKWWRKAAEQNFAEAQHNLGVCYRDGQGVVKDEVEAYKWMLLAGAQGDELSKTALLQLESLLTPDQRVEGQKRASDFKPQEVKADPSFQDPQGGTCGNAPADLLAKAEAGDAKAQNELGEAFHVGRLDVRRNPVAAVKWFRKAAEQNLAAAQSNLGVCYERGDGVAKYEVEAYKWYLLAAAQGGHKAKSYVTLLELMMTDEQIMEGKRRAQVWLEQLKTASSGDASVGDLIESTIPVTQSKP